MGLCAFELSAQTAHAGERPDTVAVSMAFYRQLEAMYQHRLDPIYAAILERAAALDVALVEQEPEQDELELLVVQDSEPSRDLEQLFAPPEGLSEPEPQFAPIVGLFRPRRFKMTAGSSTWDVRVRPSVTACVLENEGRLSKLWWTFEGVPAGVSTEDDSVQFVMITTKLAEAALPDLREAYTKALVEVTGRDFGPHRMTGNQLRVSLADNTDSSFSRLVDAMTFSSVPFVEAVVAEGDAKLRAGADEVANFITRTIGHAAEPSQIELKTGQGGLAAVFTMPVEEATSTPGAEKFVISGLASSIGMISNSRSLAPEWTKATTTPDLVRSISAARPLSARIANTGARQLDRRNGLAA